MCLRLFACDGAIQHVEYHIDKFKYTMLKSLKYPTVREHAIIKPKVAWTQLRHVHRGRHHEYTA